MRPTRKWFKAFPIALGMVVAMCACGPIRSTTSSGGAHRSSSTPAALSDGLIAYLGNQGIGVLDPRTGSHMLVENGSVGSVAPSAGGFNIPMGTTRLTGGPVWAASPGSAVPLLYFGAWWCCSKPASAASQYSWLLAGNPFAGTVTAESLTVTIPEPVHALLAVSGNQLAEGEQIDQNAYVTLFSLHTQGAATMVKPPTGSMLWLEGIAPSGQWVVASGTWQSNQTWFWFNPGTAATKPFPLPDSGTTQGSFFRFQTGSGSVAFSPDGSEVAMALPVSSASSSAGEIAIKNLSTGTGWRTLSASLPAPPTSLAWSPDGQMLAAAVGGNLVLLNPIAQGGAPQTLLSGDGISDISWSGPLPAMTMAMVRSLPDLRSAVRSIALPLSPATVPISSPTALRAVVTDGYGAAVAGAPVSFAIRGVCSAATSCPVPGAIQPSAATTGANGVATATLTPTAVGAAEVIASTGVVRVTQPILVLPAGDSSADVPAKVQATAVSAAQITATVTNAAGAPVDKAEVLFSWPGGPTGLVRPTDVNGHASMSYQGGTGSALITVSAAPPGLNPENNATAQGYTSVAAPPAATATPSTGG